MLGLSAKVEKAAGTPAEVKMVNISDSHSKQENSGTTYDQAEHVGFAVRLVCLLFMSSLVGMW